MKDGGHDANYGDDDEWNEDWPWPDDDDGDDYYGGKKGKRRKGGKGFGKGNSKGYGKFPRPPGFHRPGKGKSYGRGYGKPSGKKGKSSGKGKYRKDWNVDLVTTEPTTNFLGTNVTSTKTFKTSDSSGFVIDDPDDVPAGP